MKYPRHLIDEPCQTGHSDCMSMDAVGATGFQRPSRICIRLFSRKETELRLSLILVCARETKRNNQKRGKANWRQRQRRKSIRREAACHPSTSDRVPLFWRPFQAGGTWRQPSAGRQVKKREKHGNANKNSMANESRAERCRGNRCITRSHP